jgi:hypothetical protein
MVLNLLHQDFVRLSKLRLEPAKEFEYRYGWQGAPTDQGHAPLRKDVSMHKIR